MIKFKKAHNLKVVAVLLSIIFLCNTSLYSCPNVLNDNGDALRVPIGFVNKAQREEYMRRFTKTLDSLDVSDEREALYDSSVRKIEK